MVRSKRLVLVLLALAAIGAAGCRTDPGSPSDRPDAGEAPGPGLDASRVATDAASGLDSGPVGSAPDASAQADAASAGPDAAAPGPDAGVCEGNEDFEIGAGTYDLTGPAAELGMMGYSQVAQKTAGIHTRLRSRAFVIGSPCNGQRAVFVSADLGMVFQGVEQEVFRRLRETFGGLYTEQNVFLSATHTHSGPGGYSYYALYDLSVLGFNPQNFDAIVEGLYQSIARAHANLAPGRIFVAEGDLLDTSINRSRAAYDKNPQVERDRYPYDLDKRMTLLRLQTLAGDEIGLVDWFGVHATSMGNKNRLISGDNKGYASYRFEREKGTDYSAARSFVAAFAQATAGDSSPNIFGGEDGGGADDFESTALSGEKQLAKARELYAAASEPLRGAVDSRHVYVKMDAVDVPASLTDGTPHVTCPAAMGLSAIAGAEDGPGYGVEGASCEVVALLLPGLMCTPVQTECQAEKPIVLETGTKKPVPYTPAVLPFQLVRLGSLALVGSPFEVTTTAARRIRETVAPTLATLGVTRVIVAGPVNAYSSYVTTREEYSTQNYEGASTHFGPWQLVAVQQIYDRLAVAMQ
ncbi:MAG TPA: neutral/alkaline non-lysosomal ceramidase N-terminal domain-containing protein, partial [Myxococcales bacterium]